MTDQLPTLAGIDDTIRHNLLRWAIQCEGCSAATDRRLILLVVDTQAIRFHHGGWPDGTNPRLCRTCRLARGCHCTACDEERRSTQTVHAELRAVTPATPERKS